MASKVALIQCESYSHKVLSDAVEKALSFFGGFQEFVKSGQTVLIKPNMLAAAKPAQAVCTHPAVLESVLRLVCDSGAKPMIGDSPNLGGLHYVSRVSGILEAAKKFSAPIVSFSHPVKTKEGVYIDRTVMDVDVVLNLPKLKTHRQLFLTLSIKNLFGCMPGRRKAVMHMIHGDNHNGQDFGRMLISVYKAVKPAFTLMDGILGMEGNGPKGGLPRKFGLLLAGKDAVAVDRVVCEALSVPWQNLATLRAAKEQGAGETELDKIQIVGGDISQVKLNDLKYPKPMPITWGIPRIVTGFIKNWFQPAY